MVDHQRHRPRNHLLDWAKLVDWMIETEGPWVAGLDWMIETEGPWVGDHRSDLALVL